ncbi:sulfatase-like hydrolase/transferase [Mucilaginibacter sp. UYCu711]|uniref:sulfatase-like hydrolase/transferase n=1 Tax=Mucilaginibacter sp. UYCu711 TaxID=3156339 RepID=UPI003D1ADA21
MKKNLLPVVVIAAIGICCLGYTKEQVAKRPNVIIIYTDDQGYADMNIYGSKDLVTPNMDGLARSGVRFTNFYSASPICSPSRAALLTGRYPQRAGLPLMGPSKEGVAGMSGSQYTLGELFKDAGYKTAHIGKWHIGYNKETEPNAQGFEYSFGFMGGCIDNYSHFFYWEGPNRHDLWRNGTEINEAGKFFPDMMVDEAGKFMAENKDKPFFMYWAINNPHYPLQGKKKWLGYYKNLPSPRDKYAASISTMDENIGDLLKKLDQLGLRENTIIVFQSDQGFSREDRTFGGGGSAGEYRGSKFSLFEGGVRVPAIISWQKHIPANQVRTQVATNVDWFPTLAAYCNIKMPARKVDGQSLVPIINSADVKTNHPVFNWQSGGGNANPQWSVLDGEWKLLHSPLEATKAELTPEGYFLTNLKDDPSEKTNVADKHPDIVQRLLATHKAWLEEVFTQ